jgi:GntR family transcriptional regulator
MSIQWNESAPIYRQLRDYIKAMILDEALKEGDALPSVRQVAADFQLNRSPCRRPIRNWSTRTSSRSAAAWACTSTEGAREALLKNERERFLREEWPVRASTDCAASGSISRWTPDGHHWYGPKQ